MPRLWFSSRRDWRRFVAVCFVASLPLRFTTATEPDVSLLPPPATRSVHFVEDIQPLFNKSCLACHGPEKQRNDLRLDVKAEALQGGVSGKVILPGNSAGSLLIQMVAGLRGEDLTMPRKGARLTAEQIGLLRAWIDQGAVWPDGLDPKNYVNRREHWAFQPVHAVPPPAVKNGNFARNPVDNFIRAKLEQARIDPSSEADRRTLIRRLYLDVLGLPPSYSEVQAFESDTRPDAYERLVDRLLQSPHYGERWARHWLDVVRFAETHGFETNTPRDNAWPYRDYVIRAFNEDMPYNRFILEQLAGDAFDADAATGFIVAGPWDSVKSPDPVLTANQRADELHDIVSTTGAAFLGLTVGCARCHNHKFDPISQKDYYAFKACFAGVQHGERDLHPADSAGRLQRAAELRIHLAEVEAALSDFEPLARPLTESPVRPKPGMNEERFEPVRVKVVRFTIEATTGLEPCLDEMEIWTAGKDSRNVALASAGAKASSSGNYPNDPNHQLAHINDGQYGNSRSWISNEKGRGWVQIELAEAAAIDRVVWGRDREGKYKDRLATSYRIEVADNADAWNRSGGGAPEVVAQSAFLRAPVNAKHNVERFAPIAARQLRFTILDTTDAEPCLDELEVYAAGAPLRNIALAGYGATARASSVFPNSALHRLEHINDGLYGNSQSWIANEGKQGWVEIEFPKEVTIGKVVWSRDREGRYSDRLATTYQIEVSTGGNNWRVIANASDRQPYKAGASSRPDFQVIDLPTDQRKAFETLRAQRDELEREIKQLTTFPKVYAGKFVKPEPVYLLHRGDPMQPREPVTPGGLASFGTRLALSAEASDQERRLALARWIADARNPLAARVMVNRIWHYHFGQGIVSTPSDFGINGARPSHPELLDWLAQELVAQGWRLKPLHKLILMSHTYRQSSAANAKAARIDAGNRLLWRFSPRRLEAESIRDTVLFISGTLDSRMGGPGYDVFEPNNNYVRVYNPKRKFGPAEWRRMIYQFKPRMQQDAVFGAFDCPDGGQAAPRRTSSTTPLQALNLMNSGFILQQADFFAARLEREAGKNVAAQVQRAFQLAFSREPGSEERKAAARLVREQGLRSLCRALYNANEFIYVF